MLHYDKIETGDLHLEKRIVPIWDLLETVAKEFKLTFQSKNIRFELDFSLLVTKSAHGDIEEGDRRRKINASLLPPNIRELCVVGDPTRLAQVFRNLFNNAYKFTSSGGEYYCMTSWFVIASSASHETTIF